MFYVRIHRFLHCCNNRWETHRNLLFRLAYKNLHFYVFPQMFPGLEREVKKRKKEKWNILRRIYAIHHCDVFWFCFQQTRNEFDLMRACSAIYYWKDALYSEIIARAGKRVNYTGSLQWKNAIKPNLILNFIKINEH